MENGIYIEENAFNINVSNTIFFNCLIGLYLYKTTPYTSGLIRNIIMNNCGFSSTGSKISQILVTNQTSADFKNIEFVNCNCVMNTLPEYLIDIRNITDLLLDINSGLNNIYNLYHTSGNIKLKKYQDISTPFTIASGNSTTLVVGNPRSLLRINNPIPIFNTNVDYTFSRSQNSDGTWNCIITNTGASGNVQGRII